MKKENDTLKKENEALKEENEVQKTEIAALNSKLEKTEYQVQYAALKSMLEKTKTATKTEKGLDSDDNDVCAEIDSQDAEKSKEGCDST